MPDRYDELYRQLPLERSRALQHRAGLLRAVGRRTARASRCTGRTSRARRAAYCFWDIQQRANRLSNALAALGVKRGDRVALLLPQRPETAIAYMAIFQMGAIALPLRHLFGPDALEYRMEHAGASVAIVEPTTIANLWQIRGRLSQLRHVIGVGGARESGVHAWEALLEKASTRFAQVDTAADDPALIIYTSGTTGAPKGASRRTALLIGNLSGFVHSHDFFPQPGDMFWSPADWAWTGGLFDALLPSWAFGIPILGYRGKFDAEKAYYLLEKYGVRNSFLFPTALKLMMKAVPEPRRKYNLDLRSIMSAGESVGVTVHRVGEGAARRHHQRDVRPDRDQLRGRQLPGGLAGEARLDRPALSGAPRGGDRRAGPRAAARRTGRDRRAPVLQRRSRPGVLPRVLEEPAGDQGQVHRRLGPAPATRARWTRTATSGTRAAPTT